MPPRDLPEIVVDQLDQPVERLTIAAAPSFDEPGYVISSFRHRARCHELVFAAIGSG
jgi:hypothetical protein